MLVGAVKVDGHYQCKLEGTDEQLKEFKKHTVEKQLPEKDKMWSEADKFYDQEYMNSLIDGLVVNEDEI